MSHPLVGKTLGKYRIERLLGRGGMGAVLQGVHTDTGDIVAVKVMSQQLGEDPNLTIRFEREAKVAAQIDHPNVAKVLEYGSAQDVRYIVMEYIDGPSVGDILKMQRKLPGKQCLRVILQTAQGLEAAQRCNSIHRDIKPDNLMTTQDGQVKIVDFGLAKNDDVDSFKTATGVVMGTPHYISPEQAQGRGVDYRADMYSLGATFYHLITGHPPFDGDNAFSIVQKHVSEQVRPIEVWQPEVPEIVCSTIYRMMAKDPNDRFPTYAHLIGTLQDAIEGRYTPTASMEVAGAETLGPASLGPRSLGPGALAHDPGPASTDQSGTRRLLAIAGIVIVAVLGFAGYRIQASMDASGIAEGEIANQKLVAPRAQIPTHRINPNKWKDDTIPLLHDISKTLAAQDGEMRDFESRRARHNANAVGESDYEIRRRQRAMRERRPRDY